jgi:hypothetical protein
MLVYALLAIYACGIPLYAQTASQGQAGTAQTQTDTANIPLTPLQQRDEQVRQFDPLDRDEKDKKDNKERSTNEREGTKTLQNGQTPLPGSIAADEQNSARRSGPEVVEGDSGAAVQEYTGPAVLSRSYTIGQPLIPEQLKWQESVGLNSIYDTGINKQINADGSLGAPVTLIGTQVTWNLAGRHYFRRDMVSVSYNGNLSRYTTNTAFNGANQSITASYSHVLSRRLTLNLTGTGSILSQNYVLQNQPVGPETIANINISSSPNIQIYDLGSKQFSSQADLTWQKTSRLSFDIGTSYFGISRDSPTLLGVTGQQARGDVNYRLTRKTTIGSYYSFNHYLYPHGFGNSDTNTAGLLYSYAFNRTTQLRFRGGLSQVSSIGLETVQINPVIAALLGQSTGVIDAYQTYRTSDFSAQFVKDFRTGSTASLAYARGITPGNGVFQTSQIESISGNFTEKVFRTYTLQLGVGRDSLTAVTQNLGTYQSVYGRLGISRNYRRGIGLNLAMEFRHFDIDSVGFVRNQLRITSGVTWNPGTGRLWPF